MDTDTTSGTISRVEQKTTADVLSAATLLLLLSLSVSSFHQPTAQQAPKTTQQQKQQQQQQQQQQRQQGSPYYYLIAGILASLSVLLLIFCTGNSLSLFIVSCLLCASVLALTISLTHFEDRTIIKEFKDWKDIVSITFGIIAMIIFVSVLFSTSRSPAFFKIGSIFMLCAIILCYTRFCIFTGNLTLSDYSKPLSYLACVLALIGCVFTWLSGD